MEISRKKMCKLTESSGLSMLDKHIKTIDEKIRNKHIRCSKVKHKK